MKKEHLHIDHVSMEFPTPTGPFIALKDVDLLIDEGEFVSLIGHSGCGKSTYLRCLNRMNDTIDSARVTGSITLDGQDIYGKNLDPVALRARVGMVFQKPNPFPKSIYDNVAYGPRIHGLAADRAELDDIVHTSLERAGLLKEVKDRMDEPGTAAEIIAEIAKPAENDHKYTKTCKKYGKTAKIRKPARNLCKYWKTCRKLLQK